MLVNASFELRLWWRSKVRGPVRESVREASQDPPGGDAPDDAADFLGDWEPMGPDAVGGGGQPLILDMQGVRAPELFDEGAHWDYEGDEDDEPDAAGNPRPGTAAFYAAHRDEKIYTNAQLTVEQACYLAMTQKQRSQQRDTAFDEHCRLQHDVMLPQPNLHPPSLYLMRKVMDVRSVDDYEYHVCVCDGYAWDHLPRSEWDAHADDTCPLPTCRQPRFKKVKLLSSTRVRPRKVFYFFGVKESIKKLFAKPEWCALRGTGRDTSAAGFYGSREAQRLHDETGGRFSAPSSSAYELGFDYGQIFNFKTHSTGIMVLRCFDLPAHARSRQEFCVPLLVIPGPKEPKNLKPYLDHMLQEFKEVASQGLEVTAIIQNEDGTYRKIPMLHHVYLTAIAADALARQKLARKFWGLALATYASEAQRPWFVIPHSRRATMRQRGAGITLTADFGRPAKPLTGPGYDEGDPDSGSQLVGKAQKVSGGELAKLRRLLGSFIHRESPPGWNRQRDPDSAEVDIYTSAHKFGDEIITSAVHSASQTRCSYFVQLRFARAGAGDVEAAVDFKVAKVQKFVRAIKRPQGQAPRTLRLALCELYKARSRNGMLIIKPGSPEQVDFLVELESMDRKLVQADAPGDRMHLLRYNKVSGLK
ncbi:hypothetical protein WJX75_003063 [Coccomyxa subellipsoidea]|uniref:Uncharacterized protein n=1 Tax=Coccomyxa subellipsoidea TaxID=248742 RepID=A0ABR2YJA4_9CHLO